MLWHGPVASEQLFGSIKSDSLVYGLAVGSELLISRYHQDLYAGSSGFAYFLRVGMPPGSGVASTDLFANFRSDRSPGNHRAVFADHDYYGIRVFALSSVAAPVYSGIHGSSSGISCQSKSVMSCSFLSSDFFALNPTSSSSLRIVSQGFNVQSGLDLELHSQLVSISPSLPTFALGSETLVFTGSGIGFSKYEVLLIQDPLSLESVYMFCTVVSGQLQCSNSACP